MKKIVQIATAAVVYGGDHLVLLYALCDDGSLWERVPGKGAQWEKLPSLPRRAS